ncbi:MAG TPA: YihY/virulence factor BrkB family protein [Spirochaetota bacterium]|nr:YihY/virulence factor BrkB family protein [Spirochaetota bacterium]HPQ54971.1 YihY/virulence factor BrkB family protein [Spirochaetota bacterium]
MNFFSGLKRALLVVITLWNAVFLRAGRRIQEFSKDIYRAFKNFEIHNGELSTCAMAFFLLISFIPVSLVIISVMSFFYQSGDFAANVYLLQIKSILPSIQIERFIDTIDKIVYKKRYLALIWIPFLFWWGSLVFDIVERALEFAFRIGKSRKYWKAKIRHFIIIIGISLSALVLTIISNFIAVIRNEFFTNLIEKYLKTFNVFGTNILTLIQAPFLVSSVVTLSINTLMIFTMYRFVPPKKLDNVSMFKGALFASLSYEIIKLIFSYYITEINDYTSIFGSLSVVVILMIWIWYTCFLFVIGAEVSWVFYEKKRIRAHSS